MYRKLSEVERENGGLLPTQRAAMDKAERALGQGMMFGGELASGAKRGSAAEHAARWENGPVRGGGIAEQHGLFDEHGEAGVGRFEADKRQGVLFAADPRQKGLDFGTRGLELFDRLPEKDRERAAELQPKQGEFQTLKTKETEKGTALYAAEPESKGGEQHGTDELQRQSEGKGGGRETPDEAAATAQGGRGAAAAGAGQRGGGDRAGGDERHGRGRGRSGDVAADEAGASGSKGSPKLELGNEGDVRKVQLLKKAVDTLEANPNRNPGQEAALNRARDELARIRGEKELAATARNEDSHPRERVQQSIRKTLSSLSGKSGGSVLETEAADIGSNARAIAEEQKTTRADAERQGLIQWAVQNQRVISPDRFADRTPDDGGVEHDVHFRAFGDRVGKITRDKPLHVTDYLERLALQNAVFHDDLKIEGVTFHKPSGRVAIVTSQPFREGGENPHPEQSEIDARMKELGFEPFGNAEGLYRGNGITVADATPKNWIKEKSGELMPIDLQIVAHADTRKEAALAAAPVEAAAHEAATSPHNDLPEPSEPQKEAGNYRMGHIRVGGMDISVENPEGSVRSGVGKDGKPWETEMKAHYGYLRGTEGKDGDHVDVFVKPGTPEDFSGPVYVVNQVDPASGRFDEHKAIIGAGSREEAQAVYESNYAKGWKGVGSLVEMPLERFKEWAGEGKKTAPADALSAAVISPKRQVARLEGLLRANREGKGRQASEAGDGVASPEVEERAKKDTITSAETRMAEALGVKGKNRTDGTDGGKEAAERNAKLAKELEALEPKVAKLDGVKEQARGFAEWVKRIWAENTTLPDEDPYKRAVNRYTAKLQASELNVMKMTQHILDKVPDALAREGITNWRVAQLGILRSSGWRDYSGKTAGFMDPRESYRTLWDRINTKPGTRWADNPYVWVYTLELDEE